LAQIRQLSDTRARLTYAFGLLIDGVQAQKEIFEAFWVYRMKLVISLRPIEAERSGLDALICCTKGLWIVRRSLAFSRLEQDRHARRQHRCAQDKPAELR